MYKLSKVVLTGALTLSLLPVSNPAVAETSNQTPLKQDFQTLVSEKSDAPKVLKELPHDIKKNYADYRVVDVKNDNLGFKHYTLQPVVNNVYATNKEVKVHVNAKNEVVLVNGETNAKKVDPSNAVSISKEDAVASAFKNVNLNREKAKNLEDKVVKKNTVEIDGTRNKYVYHIELVTTTPTVTHWDVKIDASTGEVLEKTDLVQHAATKGTGRGVLGDTKSININSISGGYALEDVTSPAVMSAYTLNPATGEADLMTDKDKSFIDKEQSAGVDANDYAKKVYDYYKSTFNRASYDDRDSDIVSITHVNNYGGQDNRNNAAWIGDKMIYGDGDGVTFTNLSGADDIVAHEITHGVTQTTAGLEYQGQPGALNESFSDVFAHFVDNQDFLIGEDVYTPGRPGDALRSMSDPELYNQPSHMSRYVYTSNDNGGVHTNSGIPNKAAYLTITRLGQTRSEQIYYRALTSYLTTTSNFRDAKASLYQSAVDLYGQETANQVKKAWEEVGV
ncbi:M4 family metallopeptidase [Staphylococcus lutrae]|uniref:Neutral metalloproteinase n=1 Tax=Staphylococcus lutrae TaxID=155085 RepID=A0AAC9RNR5_9STAP|nr:M4 family metallopeptidase [Staphylococcus lutrae]ARJ50601.1 aureolysin [Staphylococcus lutrae]PNZ36662.1 peptidase M4 family protein [Staphylococcus lutrae]